MINSSVKQILNELNLHHNSLHLTEKRSLMDLTPRILLHLTELSKCEPLVPCYGSSGHNTPSLCW